MGTLAAGCLAPIAVVAIVASALVAMGPFGVLVGIALLAIGGISLLLAFGLIGLLMASHQKPSAPPQKKKEEEK